MMKRIVLFSMLAMMIAQSFAESRLVVSSDQSHLQDADGRSFLYLGDTAWELFHQLSREEADYYLKKRRAQGYSVIQAVILAENDGLRKPNYYGDVPFKNLDPTQPNEAYFKHVDTIVQKAAEQGLWMGLLPTWGDKVYSVHPGAGPVVFTPENAEVYGRFLGNRYKGLPVIWILGGDRQVDSDEVLEIWRSMARGIESENDGKQLMTFHPRGGASSAYWLHNEPWLDFNLYQSGHNQRYYPVYDFAENHFQLQPRKPFVDGEPAYEDIAMKFWAFMDFSQPPGQRVPEDVETSGGLILKKEHFAQGFFTDYDVRVHGYWNLLSGACGYTYGNNTIWQMYKKGDASQIPCLTYWKEALDRPGAEDIRHIRTLFEARPFHKLLPDQSLIYGKNPKGENHIRAAISRDYDFLMVYLAKGQSVRLVMGKLKGKVSAWWYCPREGQATLIGPVENKGLATFHPPSAGENNDWMLVVDRVEDYPEALK